VLKKNPKYVERLLSAFSNKPKPSERLSEFLVFCRKAGAKPARLPDEDPFDPDSLNLKFFTPDIGKTAMQVGKHKGQAYEDVLKNDRSYAVWARGLLNPSAMGLKDFVCYCAAAGVQRPSKVSNYNRRKNPNAWWSGGWNGHGCPYANGQNRKRKRKRQGEEEDEEDEDNRKRKRQVVMSRV